MTTPYYLIQERILHKNIQDFKDGMTSNWKNSVLCYSVKTNSLPWVLRYVRQNGGFAEVVSDEEYDLAVMCGFSPSEIVFNGPIKGKEHFIDAVKSGAIVNIDSDNELSWVEEYKKPVDNLGIRVNVPPEEFRAEDIEYTDDGFRFGFAVENGEFKKALDRLSRTQNIKHIGIHLHCNSITRSKEVYRSIALYAVKLIEEYDLEPGFIDIGGGFFGGVPGKTTISEYFSVISQELRKTKNTKDARLLAEPGSAIIGSAIELHSSVIDVKDTNHSRIVTTDGGRVYTDPQWFRTHYMFEIKTSSEKTYMGEQVICGYTCMDHDRIMALSDATELGVGDEIIYYRVGAYTVTFGGPFIKYYPEVYVKTDDGIAKVRRKMNVNDYYRIQTDGGI